jgi:hypothetical protein
MLLSARIYGAPAVRLIATRGTAPVLVLGRDTFTRADLAAVECFAFTAARNVSTILDTAKIKSTAHLYAEFSPFDLALPRLGVISLMVIGAAFEIRGVGTIETWALKHKPKDQAAEFLSFSTIKHHHDAAEHVTAAASRRARRRRAATT